MAPLASLSLLCVTLLVCATAPNATAHRTLREGFYSETCPRAEEIVRETVEFGLLLNPGAAGGLIRLFTHDCLVKGCDASILLDDTPTGEPVEKDSPPNRGSLRGLSIIDDAKRRLESVCPGTVSCADILAFAARDAVVLSSLSSYSVPAGRRDACASRATDVAGNLLPPTASVSNLTSLFAAKGFSQEEMVTLLGAHSVGGAVCPTFDYRLYNYRPGQPQDPTMDPLFASYLKLRCPRTRSYFFPMMRSFSNRYVPFNPLSALRQGNTFYVDLIKGKALLESDQGLMGDADTSSIVRQMAAAGPAWWAEEFGRAMVKLGKVGVLTGNRGEVRRWCRRVN
ncbi:hypothetical protein Taro_052050 [Colocasia esculenta]|uniref:Peroxidase n=1 Tax=Colocasia esculenta TaxID=4460 RepID=A0A843XIP5_COLES|nr:hypothetical protein [Colocasia esculenta]